MAKFVTTIETDRPAADAFRYLADLENMAEWDPSVREVRRLTPGPTALNTHFDVELSLVPVGPTQTLHYRVTAFQEGRLVTIEADASMFRSLDVISVLELGNRTRVTYDAEVELKGVLAFSDPAFVPAFNLYCRRPAKRLREVLGGREVKV